VTESHFRPYPTYAELTERLESLAARYPHILSLSSIGETPEGRSIWMATLTDTRVGDGENKPAIWLDGNTHAAELASSAMCLYACEQLCEGSEEQDDIRQLLERVTFYVVPRISADGAEFVLREGKPLRSAPRPWPEDRPPGFQVEDMDGDGRVRQMRVQSPGGAWKSSSEDSRLMTARGPGDQGGPFYDLYPEGFFEEGADLEKGLDGTSSYGHDFNRNYPQGWRGVYDQKGAGDYPLSHPETRAVVDQFLRCNRVSVALTYHTYCGAILRPFSDGPDEGMNAHDLGVYEDLGKMGSATTGYPAFSVYHGFTRLLPTKITGGFDDWAYLHTGAFAFTIELWNVAERAGVQIDNPANFHFMGGMSDAQLKQVLDWSDQHPQHKGFKDWTPVDHPQLGPVEVGGWDRIGFWQNPPASELEAECEKNFRFVLDLANTVPQLGPVEVDTKLLGPGVWQVTVAVSNEGYLPTSGSKIGEERGNKGRVQFSLDLSEGCSLLEGRPEFSVDALSGVSTVHQGNFTDSVSYGGARCQKSTKASWVIEGAGSVTVSVDGAKAGRRQVSVTLDK